MCGQKDSPITASFTIMHDHGAPSSSTRPDFKLDFELFVLWVVEAVLVVAAAGFVVGALALTLGLHESDSGCRRNF